MVCRWPSSWSRCLNDGPTQQLQLDHPPFLLELNITRLTMDTPMAIRMMGQMFRSSIDPTPMDISKIPQKNIIHPQLVASSVRSTIISQKGFICCSACPRSAKPVAALAW